MVKSTIDKANKGELSEDKIQALTDFYPYILYVNITSKTLLSLSDKLYQTDVFRANWLEAYSKAEKVMLSGKLTKDGQEFR